MGSQVVYKTRIYNYYLIIPLLIIGSIALIGLLASIGSNIETLPLLIPFLIIIFLFLNLFRLDLEVSHQKLMLSLGPGWFKKSVFINDLDLAEFQEQPVKWYLRGSVFKYDFNGNIIFCPYSGPALKLKYKNAANALLIVTPNNEELFNALKNLQVDN